MRKTTKDKIAIVLTCLSLIILMIVGAYDVLGQCATINSCSEGYFPDDIRDDQTIDGYVHKWTCVNNVTGSVNSCSYDDQNAAKQLVILPIPSTEWRGPAHACEQGELATEDQFKPRIVSNGRAIGLGYSCKTKHSEGDIYTYRSTTSRLDLASDYIASCAHDTNTCIIGNPENIRVERLVTNVWNCVLPGYAANKDVVDRLAPGYANVTCRNNRLIPTDDTDEFDVNTGVEREKVDGQCPIDPHLYGAYANCRAGIADGVIINDRQAHPRNQYPCRTTQSWTCHGYAGGRNAHCQVNVENIRLDARHYSTCANVDPLTFAKTSCNYDTLSCQNEDGSSAVSIPAGRSSLRENWICPWAALVPNTDRVYALGRQTEASYCLTNLSELPAIAGSCGDSVLTCESGTVTNITRTVNVETNWTCAGLNNGESSQCSTSNVRVDAECSTDYVDYCVLGTYSDRTDNSTHYRWSCIGNLEGSNAMCSAEITTDTPLPGECSENLHSCTKGSLSDEESETNELGDEIFTWTCEGDHRGRPDFCSYRQLSGPECSDTNRFACSPGLTIETGTNSTHYTWKCSRSDITIECNRQRSLPENFDDRPNTFNREDLNKEATQCSALAFWTQDKTEGTVLLTSLVLLAIIGVIAFSSTNSVPLGLVSTGIAFVTMSTFGCIPGIFMIIFFLFGGLFLGYTLIFKRLI